MNMQNQLQKLTDAVSALEGSQARARLLRLFDEGTFVEIDRLARDGEHAVEAVAGYGTVEGSPAYAFAQDRDVCCGAIGKAQAAKLLKVYQLAAQNGAPVVGVFDSDGAKLGEGIDAMDAIADILYASNTISGVVPQIAVLTGPCVGSSAIVAANADVVVSVEGADYYLNPGDESSVGNILVADADAALAKARELIAFLPSNNLAASVAYDFESLTMPECDSIQTIIEAVADAGSVIMLGSSRNATAFARIGGMACGLVTMTTEKLCDKGSARLGRFIRLCDSFSIPVITFADCTGFYTLQAAAKLAHVYAETTTAKLTVIVGKAYGPLYIAVAGKSAGADAVLAWPTATILPLAPETAVHILWKDKLAGMANPTEDRAKLAEEFAETEGSALAAAAKGYVTDVIAPAETKARLTALLEMLSGKRVSRLPKKHSNIVL